MAGRTTAAATARRNEPEDHVVAGSQPTDTLANLAHDPRTFVTADDGQGEGQVARDEVFVAVAHARSLHLHQHLARLGIVELDLLDAPRLVHLPQNGGRRLHDSPWNVPGGRPLATANS